LWKKILGQQTKLKGNVNVNVNVNVKSREGQTGTNTSLGHYWLTRGSPKWVFILFLGGGGVSSQPSNFKSVELVEILDAPNPKKHRVWGIQDLDQFFKPDPRVRNAIF
jgi:hypothetical protein